MQPESLFLAPFRGGKGGLMIRFYIGVCQMKKLIISPFSTK